MGGRVIAAHPSNVTAPVAEGTGSALNIYGDMHAFNFSTVGVTTLHLAMACFEFRITDIAIGPNPIMHAILFLARFIVPPKLKGLWMILIPLFSFAMRMMELVSSAMADTLSFLLLAANSASVKSHIFLFPT